MAKTILSVGKSPSNEPYNGLKLQGAHSNIDDHYGPYTTEEEAKRKVASAYRGVGLTVGIYNFEKSSSGTYIYDTSGAYPKYVENPSSGAQKYVLSGISEYWWNTGTTDDDLNPKIEEFGLKLTGDVNPTIITQNGEEVVQLHYTLSGKGFIKEAVILQNGAQVKTFSPQEGEHTIVISKPTGVGTYTYGIYVTDMYGQATDTITGTIDIGTIDVKNLNISSVLNAAPKNQNTYGGRQGENRFRVDFTLEYISTISITSVSLGGRPGDVLDVQVNGKKYTVFINALGSGEHQLTINYKKNGQNQPSMQVPNTSFYILEEDELVLHLDQSFNTILQGTKTGIPLRIDCGNMYAAQVVVSSAKAHTSYTFNAVTTNSNITLTLPYNALYENYNVEHDISDEVITITVSQPQYYPNADSVQESRSVTIKHVDYLNFLNDSGEAYDSERLYSINEQICHINTDCNAYAIDFYLKVLKTGDDKKLITINIGNTQSAVIYEEHIEPLGFWDSNQCSEIVMPDTNGFIHVGIGVNRVAQSVYGSNIQTHFSSVAINGVIVYNKRIESEAISNLANGTITITANNPVYIKSWNILYAGANQSLSAIYTGGTSMDREFDTIFYNYLVAKTLDAEDDTTDITGGDTLPNVLELINVNKVFGEQYDSASDSYSINQNDTSPFSSKLKKLVKIGQVGTKSVHAAADSDPRTLMQMVTSQKSNSQKRLGTICAYRMTHGDSVTTGLVEMHTQGTSTLDYAIPNFKFTFYRYNQSNEIEEDEKKLSDSWATAETVLTAKADYMDSSHLNNTPTCTFINNFVNHFNTEIDEAQEPGASNDDGLQPADKLESPAIVQRRFDAIEGELFIIKINEDDDQDTVSLDTSTFDAKTYTSLGSFVLNIDKEGENLYLENCTSLEGSSNVQDANVSSAAQFVLKDGMTNKLSYTNGGFVLDSFASDSEKDEVTSYIFSTFGFEDRGGYPVVGKNGYNDTQLNAALKMWYFAALPDDSNDSNDSDNSNQTIDPYLPSDFNYNDDSHPYINLFHNHFSKMFDKNYAMFYFINLMCFGQVDNLGKNMMVDSWWEGGTNGVWYFRPYDLDSELGLNNQGNDRVPPYVEIREEYHKVQEVFFADPAHPTPEETQAKRDFDAKQYQYSSRNSNFWVKFVKCFKSDIDAYYRKLRKHGYTPEAIIDNAKTLIIDKMSVRQNNYDFYYKYIGTSEQEFYFGNRWDKFQSWIKRRFRFCDTYFNYYDNLRISTNSGTARISVDVNTPIYLGLSIHEDTPDMQYVNKDFPENRTSSMLDLRSTGVQYDIVLSLDAVRRINNLGSALPFNSFAPTSAAGGSYSFKNVYNLNIEGSAGNYKNVSSILDSFPNLVSLDLKYFQLGSYIAPQRLNTLLLKNSNTSFALNLRSATSLQTVELENVSISGDLEFINIPTLTSIKLRNVTLPDGCKLVLQSLPLLGELIVEGCSIDKFEYSGNIGLQSLDLSGQEWTSITFPNEENNNLTSLTIDQLVEVSNVGGGSGERITTEFHPKIKELNLSNLKALRNLSCVGCNKLETLTLPDLDANTQFTLNLENCTSLDTITNPTSVANDTGSGVCDFQNLNLLAKQTAQNPLRLYCVLISNGVRTLYALPLPTHFTLCGCAAIQHIKNLKYAGDGDLLFADCEALTTFTNCQVTIKNTASKIFYGCTQLQEIPSDISFSDSESASPVTNFSGAFASTYRLSMSSIYPIDFRAATTCSAMLAGKSFYPEANADGATLSLASFGFTDSRDHIINFYQFCSRGIQGHSLRNCLIAGVYKSISAASDFVNKGTNYNLDYLTKVTGQFPSGTGASLVRVFVSRSKLTSVPYNIIENCSQVENLYGAFGGTRIYGPVNFPATNSIKNISTMYDRNENFGTPTTEQADAAGFDADVFRATFASNLKTQFLKLNKLESANAVFYNDANLKFDTAGLFVNPAGETTFNKLTSLNGCFAGTKCYCNGKIFETTVKNIAGLFGHTAYTSDAVLNLSWIDNEYEFNSISNSYANNSSVDMTTETLYGAFSGCNIQYLPGVSVTIDGDIYKTFPVSNTGRINGCDNLFANSTITASSCKFKVPGSSANQCFYKATLDSITKMDLSSVTQFEEGLCEAASLNLASVNFGTNVQSLRRSFAAKDNLGSPTFGSLNIHSIVLPRSVTTTEGMFKNWYFTSSSDTEIGNMIGDCTNLENADSMFQYSGITKFSGQLPSNIVSCKDMFSDCTSLTTVIGNLFSNNLPRLKDVSGLFQNTALQGSLELSLNNISSVEDTSNMFADSRGWGANSNTYNLEVSLSGNLNMLKTAYRMFYKSNITSTVDFDSDSVTNVEEMFDYSQVGYNTASHPNSKITQAYNAAHSS